MLFNILTNDASVLASINIDVTEVSRLVYAKDGFTQDEGFFRVGFDGIFGYKVKRENCFQPILEKVAVVVYKTSERRTIMKTMLLDRVIEDVDGVSFIKQFLDKDGNDVTNEIYNYIVDNYVVVLNQTSEIVSRVCQHCGEVFIGEREICDPCYKKQLEEMKMYRKRQGYSWKPRPIFNKADKREKCLHMGFELEMEDERCELDPDSAVGYVHEVLNKDGDELTVYCKYDGSLEDGGVEMVSHPRTLDYFMDRYKDFENVYDNFIDEGWRSEKGGHCGLHVHIDKKFLGKNVDYVCAKIGYIFSLFWDELLCISRRSSSGLGYCHKNDIDVNDSRDVIIDKIKDQKYDGDRYVAVNNKPEHTLEIRLWRGTLNARTVMATLDLTRAIVLCAKKYSINTLQTISFGDIINKMKYEENKNAIINRLTEKGVAGRLTPTRKIKKENK